MFTKKLLTVLISATALTVSALTASAADFSDINSYDWYAKEVQSAYESGLMYGTGNGLFKPCGEVTVAEAITLASRVCALYAGEEIPEADGEEWYDMYTSYAVSKGIISENQFDDYDRAVKRHETAALLRKALPQSYYSVQNTIDEIPDISPAREYHDQILDLYKAGVLVGNDAFGNFYPEHSITRAETAALINRVVFPEKRIVKDFEKVTEDDAYPLTLTNGFNTTKEGISSGWLLDNRGGVPRYHLNSVYGPIFDIRTDAGVAYIREFNKTSEGYLELLTSLTVRVGEGLYLEYQNDAGESVYRLQIVDGDWCILQTDGTMKKIYDIDENEDFFKFEIKTDLDNDYSETRINDIFCGRFPLTNTGKDSNVLNYRYATTDESLAIATAGATYIYSNYSLIEDFGLLTSLPYKWNGTDGISISQSVLNVSQNASATARFDCSSGNVAAEVNFLLPEREIIEYRVLSNGKTAAVFTNDENAFYVNGIKVYEDYYSNLWYRLRLEFDTDAQKLLVKVNGIKRGEVEFSEAVTSIDTVTVTNFAETTAIFDDFKVMRLPVHSDYVPAPVVPEGEENYTVGLNVCSLWRNGGHYGWSCITPYDDPEPVLGYYDEGIPETADWEIKYLVEHGVDFQMFCIYFNNNSGVQKLSAHHLYDGFMNAKYSDMTKYCIIWEAANAGSPSSMDEMKNNFAPYIIENFLKDPRYMTIDNKPVICVFGGAKIASRLGSNAASKEALDYLEAEAIKLGFDGIIYLVCGTSSEAFAEMGYDGCYAYNWGNVGYSLDINKTYNLNSAKNSAIYTVPTASVGFNSIPWHGIRYPLMTMDDYAELQKWIKEEYLPQYATESWQKNLVMISTWNEYGEGTYVMPSVDEKGFGYIDVLREAYTSEKADPSLNNIPTENQKYRINHLYPQYRRLLRKEGWYKEELADAELKLKYALNYSDYTPSPSICWSMKDYFVDENGITATSTTSDPILIIQNIDNAPVLDDVIAIKITAKVPIGSTLQIFYTTMDNTEWDETKSYRINSVSTDETASYIIPTSTFKNFTGQLKGLRIDPCNKSGATFTVKSVEFYVTSDLSNPKEITINEQTFLMKLPKSVSETGDTLIAFDPSVGFDFRLNSFHVWDKKTGTLELNFPKNRKLIYTVGSDKYTVDGEKKELGYVLPEIDGIPYIPLKRMCEEIGYSYTIDADGRINVVTDELAYIKEQTKDRVPYQWEFNSIGDTESWVSSFMSMLVSDGYVSCESTSDSTDPTINLSGTLELAAEDYETLEIRVRYKYNSKYRSDMVMYFSTDQDQTMDEKKKAHVTLKSIDTGENWEVYTIDLTKISTWKDTVTKLRFDPFNSTGHMDVDYIRFIKKQP